MTQVEGMPQGGRSDTMLTLAAHYGLLLQLKAVLAAEDVNLRRGCQLHTSILQLCVEVCIVHARLAVLAMSQAEAFTTAIQLPAPGLLPTCELRVATSWCSELVGIELCSFSMQFFHAVARCMSCCSADS